MPTKGQVSDTLEENSQAGETSSFVPDLPEEYEILEKVSEGGMGAIFKAKNKYTDAVVAIKVMKSTGERNEKALARFIVEAKAASLLNHPRICQVRNFGLTHSKVPYLVMDWISGIPLGRKITRDGPLNVADAVIVFQQICAGLGDAHAHNVVHRDLKPDNIMLTRGANGATDVYIVDFGIAKMLKNTDGDLNATDANPSTETSVSVSTVAPGGQLTTTGTFIGTPLFMSPEQARALGNLDLRSDIYSLGCLMYFVLSGKAPLVGISPIDTIAKHLHQKPEDFSSHLKIPSDLRTVIFKCMEKSPDDRYQAVSDISSDLSKLTKGVNIVRRPLAHEREEKRKKLIKVGSFVVGFIAMYLISVSVQNALDAPEKLAHKKVHKPAVSSTPVRR